MDAVLEAAAQVFEREGMAATTNRIAERAGVSIGTLYQYFPNKRALLYTLAERHLDAAHRSLAAVSARLAAERPDWPDTLRILVDAVVELHRDRPRLHAVLYEFTPRVPHGVARLRALHEAMISEVAAQLRRCGRDQAGAPAPETRAATLVHTADALLHRLYLGPGGVPDGTADELVGTLLALTDQPTG